MEKRDNLLWLIVVLSGGYMLLYVNMTKDDTFIFLQFVRNMLLHREMSFNVGEPTYGFTSVLWTGILYGAGRISPYLLLNAKVLSFLCSLVALGSVYSLSQRLLSTRRWQLAATAAFALNPVFVYISFSGMETPVAVLLVVTGIGVYLKERDRDQWFYLGPVLFACAYLTRPEMLLLIVLAIVDIGVNAKQPHKLRMMLIFVVEYILLLLPWLLVAQYNFGTIIPNPVIIKAVQSLSDYSLAYIVKRVVLLFGSMHSAELILLLASCGLLLWRRNFSFLLEFLKKNIFIILWVDGLLASYLVQKVSVSPRYLLIISPFVTLLACIILERVGQGWSSRGRRFLLGVTAALFLGQSALATTQIYYPHALSYNQKDIALKEVALWLRDHSSPGSSVAAIDIGILGYFSERKVVDLTGLINPEKIKTPMTIDYLKEKAVGYYLDRHPVPYYLEKEKINASKWLLKPLIYRSAKSIGWHYNFVENQKIGFSLYQITWK